MKARATVGCAGVAALVLAALLMDHAAAAGAGAVHIVPVPPPTALSQMWLDPALPGTPEAAELETKGYIREEFFQSGEANVYGYAADGNVRLERRGIPYTTRVIVIRPGNERQFSGTVQLNPFHPMYGMSAWSTMKDYALERGDAFVGVMAGADDNTRRAAASDTPLMATRVLGWFNPERYAIIRWPEDEDGIRWDVFADTARLVRSPGALLGPLRATHVYASGWSFTGSFLRTFINSGFHAQNRRAGGGPLVDGYLIGISSFSFGSGYVPINSQTPNLSEADPRRANVAIDVPVIELQSENEAISNREPQTPDKDGPPGAHRLYEVPGITHGGGRRRSSVLPQQLMLRTGTVADAPPDTCPFPQSDIDMADFAGAAHANLDRWVRDGIPPPRAGRLRTENGTGLKDTNGNTLGGVRPAQIEVPLASYGPAPAESGCDPARPRIGSAMIPMRRVPLPADRLQALYPGGRSEYLHRLDAAVDQLVEERWIRPADAARQKREARAAAAAATALLANGVHAADPARATISGAFPDGTRWSVTRPANWNHAFLLDLDGAGFALPPPGLRIPGAGAPGVSPGASSATAGVGSSINAFREWLLSEGYAVGGTMREPVGYQFDRAVDHLVEVRRLFIAEWGEPVRTLALGGSRGAFVARLAMERRPEIFAGALVYAGGGGGLIAGLLDRLNASFALKTLVDPDAPLQLVNITDVAAGQAALVRLVEKANSTPQGRARLALAGAFEQFAPWSSRGKPRPAPDDHDAQLDQIAENFVFANPSSVRAGVEKMAGGNVSWNTGVDYADLLRRSGRQSMVEAVYEGAGLDLSADLAVLARAPRISADPAAVARAEQITSYTGRIKGPVVNVDNDDPVDPASYKLAYQETLRKAGTEQLLRVLWADQPGHGGQSSLDRAVAFRLLIRRLDTGSWGDDSLPALRAMGVEIARTSPVDLGKLTLFRPNPIPRPLFTWDSSNWNTYRD